MTVTVFVLTCIGTLIAVGTLYLFARQNSISARERAISEARAPLEREIQDLRDDVTQLRIDNRDLRQRCEHLEDELRRRQ